MSDNKEPTMEQTTLSKDKEVYITTHDNPYDPSKDFKEWFIYDESNGYHTCSLLDRMSNTAFNALTDEENTDEIERAIDEIIKIQGDNLYKKIVINKTS